MRDLFLYYNKPIYVSLYCRSPLHLIPDQQHALLSDCFPMHIIVIMHPWNLRKKSSFSYFFACILSLARSRTHPQVLDTGLTPQDWLTQPDWENTNRNSPNSLSLLEIDIFSFWPAQMQQRDNKEGKGAADLSSCAVKMRLRRVQKGIRYNTQPLFALLLHSSHIFFSSLCKGTKAKTSTLHHKQYASHVNWVLFCQNSLSCVCICLLSLFFIISVLFVYS